MDFSYPSPYRYGPREPEEKRAVIQLRDGDEGAPRMLVLAENISDSIPRQDLFQRHFALYSGDEGRDQFRLGFEARDGFRRDAVMAELQLFNADRHDGSVLRLADIPGTLAWSGPTTISVLFVLDPTVTDPVLAEAARQGAKRLVSRWVDQHRLRPREYREGKFSEGWLLVEDDAQWRPMPRAKLPDGQRYPGILYTTGKVFDPIQLAQVVEEENATVRQ